MTWIYPSPGEYPDSAFDLLYTQRDRHFFNLARHLHPRLVMLCCKLYVAALFPLIVGVLLRKSEFGNLMTSLNLTNAEIFRSIVFYTYDNVAPYYQHRHKKSEVLFWYGDCNFKDVYSEKPGLYVGFRQ